MVGFNVISVAALGLIVAMVVLMVGGVIGDKLQEQTTVNGTAYNITVAGGNAINDFANWFPTLVVVIVAVIILGLIIGFGRVGGNE